MNAWNVKIKQIDDTNDTSETKQSNHWQQMYSCIEAKMSKRKIPFSQMQKHRKSNLVSITVSKTIVTKALTT